MSARLILAAALSALIGLPASGQASDLDRLRNAIAAGYAGTQPLFVRSDISVPPPARPPRASQGKTGRTGCATGLSASGAGCASIAFAAPKTDYPGQPARPKIYSLVRAVPIGTQGRVGVGLDLPRLMAELPAASRSREAPRFGSSHRR